MHLGNNEVVIHDGNAHEFLSPVVDGEVKARGGVPRNYDTHPAGHYAAAPCLKVEEFNTFEDGEITDRLAKLAADNARLSDVRNRGNAGKPIPSRDQNGRGYCWMHSGTSALLVLRAGQNEPYADLSAYGPACKIKHFKDEGGWGAQGVDFLKDTGVPTSNTWPQRATDRSLDNPKTWEEAKLYRVTEGFWDLDVAQYDRKLTYRQVLTLLVLGVPVVVDYNWWSHSVCAIDVVAGAAQRQVARTAEGKLLALHEFDRVFAMNDPVTAGLSVRIWNSWGDSWSENGTGVLTGNKAVPDGAVAPRVATAA